MTAWSRTASGVGTCDDIWELASSVLIISDVFLLDHFPCRVVEIVAWVAGVVHKESTVTVTRELAPKLS